MGVILQFRDIAKATVFCFSYLSVVLHLAVILREQKEQVERNLKQGVKAGKGETEEQKSLKD